MGGIVGRGKIKIIMASSSTSSDGFSRSEVATSLIPIDAILPEICAFIAGFSCTVWTKMRSLRAH